MYDLLATFLEQLFHRCIIKSYFPDALNVAKVVLLHKEGDKHEPTNYRPFSLQPTIGKFFEKLIYNRLVYFPYRHHILREKQFGFLRKRAQLVPLLHWWKRSVNYGQTEQMCLVALFLT